ncbi:MAG: VWA domain-containing protein [Actinomycetota bacterium]
MSYERRVDRDHPACFVFLIDQSYSMIEPAAGAADRSKAKALAEAVNDLIYELVIRSVKNPNELPRRYYDLAVIGYGGHVGPAWGGALTGRDLIGIDEIAQNPVRVEDRPDGTRFPIWFEAVNDGPTPMSAAMDQAGRLVAGWVQGHPDSFPPVIVNISDGAATDGDPRMWAERLGSLSTSDGAALVFNVNISSTGGAPLWFPDNATAMPSEYAQAMFDMSSVLPGFMQELAAMEGHAVTSGSRGFVFNADITSIVNFLQIGTSTQHVGADSGRGGDAMGA